VEPVPETMEAIAELAAYGDTEAAIALLRMGRLARQIVPEVVGLSLGLLEENLTFTLVASDQDIAALDAVQYLDGGPCVDVAHGADPVEYHPGSDSLVDEDKWRMFAQASAAAGIASTLSLPIVRHDQVIGSVNLYASTPDAFAGRHEQLASACGAWAPGAVTNGDLGFRTRLEAAQAPQRMRDRNDVDLAIGVIAEAQRVDVDVAAERLREAAARAGITEAQAARVIGQILNE
jgi:GAF domain-containing protein